METFRQSDLPYFLWISKNLFLCDFLFLEDYQDKPHYISKEAVAWNDCILEF